MRPARVALVVTYVVLAVAGLVGTWYFNLEFFAQDAGSSYLASWFANSASSSAAVDLIVMATVASILMAVEAWRLRLRWLWVLIPLSFLVAVAFTFPLFLAVREVRMARSGA